MYQANRHTQLIEEINVGLEILIAIVYLGRSEKIQEKQKGHRNSAKINNWPRQATTKLSIVPNNIQFIRIIKIP